MPDLSSRFQPDPLPPDWRLIETPVPVIDLGVVARNLQRWQARCDGAGFANRPHIKTHKQTALALHQLELGAAGITVQKLGEAEVMADAGIRDMFLTFNVLGASKLKRLAALMGRSEIRVVADNAEMLEGLDTAARTAGRKLEVLVECDTGGARNGVQSPDAAAVLARAIEDRAGLVYSGLMTFPAVGGRAQMSEFLAAAIAATGNAGLATRIVSVGGTPDMMSDEGLERVTEYRAGTYIYNDRSLLEAGRCSAEDCALDVLATVVSRPTADRAVIDAGSKALTSDLLGLEGFGVERGSGALVYAMSEEHGLLDISKLAAPPAIGDLVRIIPNHVCPVSNLFDRVVLADGGKPIGLVPVDARGRVD